MLSDDAAEQVAVAMQSGPDLAEFVSDYLELPFGAHMTRDDLASQIAESWAEHACDAVPDASDDVYQDVVSNVKPQIQYYLS